MKTLADSANILAAGLGAIRAEFHVPGAFAVDLLAAADAAAARAPTDHADRTATHFVTLDPAGATDLDQALAIERAGADLLLHYAIADVGWFVRDGDPLDREAWKRGATLYLPDGKARLYPAVLSEGAASLLPAGPRPAIVFTVRVSPDGMSTLDGAERALVLSRAKLAYETVTAADLPPGFADLAARVQAAEARRGASRVDPPQQEVVRLDDGSLDLGFRPRLPAEDANASLSLATNLAVANGLLAHHTGLFRVMGGPDAAGEARLRHTAEALKLDWPAAQPLAAFQKTLAPADARQADMMLAIRKAGRGASYMPYKPGVVPWHAAMAATYAHATAPLRRLADRYVVEAALAIASGRPVPETVEAAFARLPAVMARAEGLDAQIQRAVIDFVEAVLMAPSVGDTFAAVVTDADDRGARIQLRDHPVVARIAAPGLGPGDALRVRLTTADPERRTVGFERIG